MTDDRLAYAVKHSSELRRTISELESELAALRDLHASLVTKIKATRGLIYKTQRSIQGGKSGSGCLEVVDGVLTEIIERLEAK